MVDRISVATLEALVTTDEVFEDNVLRYLEIDEANSRAFDPVLKLRDGLYVDAQDLGGLSFLDWMNQQSRESRQRRYRRRIESRWSGIRIVSEGDSWFQLPMWWPLWPRDVVDQIFDDYAIYSLGAGGDSLGRMVREREYIAAINREQPHVLLVSGGGNDLVGPRLSGMLHECDPGREPDDYPTDRFSNFLDAIAHLNQELFEQVESSHHPEVAVLCHGYDYAIPAGGSFLGRPMESRGIVDPALQANIMRVLVDRLNDKLTTVTNSFGSVHLVNCRGAVHHNGWFDELHPYSRGFRAIAERFCSCIDDVVDV